MKRFLIVLLSLLLAAACAIGFAACTEHLDDETGGPVQPVDPDDPDDPSGPDNPDDPDDPGEPHEHNFGEWVVTIPATCTELGEEQRTCSCGETETREIAASGHTEVVDAAVEPTCTETGLTEGKHCSVCNTVLVKQEVIPAKGHMEVIDAAVEPTCTETGLTEGKRCSVCGAVLVEQEVVPALDHNWDEGWVMTTATCTQTGVKSYTCERCGETKTEAIAALGHAPAGAVRENVEAASCEEPDSYDLVMYCSRCDAELSRKHVEGESLGHAWDGGKITTSATCTHSGVMTYTCERCGETKTEPIAMKEHTIVTDAAVAPTCTETGLTEGKHCSVCNTVLVEQEVIPSKGHTEVIDTAVEPTCTKTGLTEGRRCSVCGAVLVEQEVIPSKGHTEVIDTAVEPTCTKTGLTEGRRCSVCGVVLVEQEVIPSKGHTEVTDAAVEPTCTETGLTEGKHCSVCGAVLVEQQAVAAKGHQFDNDHILTCQPTCITDGYTYAKCLKCGYRKLIDLIPATGHHHYIDGVCTVCGEQETVTTEGLQFIRSIDGSYYIVSGYTGTAAEVEVPSEYNGMPVKEIGERAFYNCSNVTSIIMPDSITKLCDWAFYRCGGLTEITLPKGIEEIGTRAFYSCTNLESLFIPSSVRQIGEYAFHNCSSLKSIQTEDLGAWCCINFAAEYANPLQYDGIILYCNGKPQTDIVIPDGTSCINNWAFAGYNALNSITLPNSVRWLGDSAFENCTGLTGMTIPDSVTSIGNSAFSSCTSLTSIMIPNSVTSIGDSAFSSCTSLTSITIPDSVTSIGSSAFNGCSSLTSVMLPADLISIEGGIFEGCSSLTSILIPDSVTSIGGSAFSSCDSLTSITIPNSVTSIEGWAFADCSSLTCITIPDSVISIGIVAFLNCSSLTRIMIPDSVISIGDDAFLNCYGLTIYCQAASQPSGWSSSWNADRPVVWGYSADEVTYHFVSNGGPEIESIVSALPISLPRPEKDGYIFAGRYLSSDLSSNALHSPYYNGILAQPKNKNSREVL